MASRPGSRGVPQRTTSFTNGHAPAPSPNLRSMSFNNGRMDPAQHAARRASLLSQSLAWAADKQLADDDDEHDDDGDSNELRTLQVQRSGVAFCGSSSSRSFSNFATNRSPSMRHSTHQMPSRAASFTNGAGAQGRLSRYAHSATSNESSLRSHCSIESVPEDAPTSPASMTADGALHSIDDIPESHAMLDRKQAVVPSGKSASRLSRGASFSYKSPGMAQNSLAPGSRDTSMNGVADNSYEGLTGREVSRAGKNAKELRDAFLASR